MSVYFEAVVVAADQTILIRLLDNLAQTLDSHPFARIPWELYRVGDCGFVLFGLRADGKQPQASHEVEDLADELSLEFGCAVAVHYDDQVGVRTALLSKDGELARSFGETDEMWVPYDAHGELITDGPRYPGDALPADVECDCIRNGIDAALQVAGFQEWIYSARHGLALSNGSVIP